MKKISFGLLDELAKDQEKISELEMKSFVGGGSGTVDDPYSITEMESLMDSCQWDGGYVEYLGYVSFSPHVYGSYYGGYCNQYNGNLADQILTLINSGWDQVAMTIISSIPYLNVTLSYMMQEFHDCKAQMLADIVNLGYSESQIDFVSSPGSYSSNTTDWCTIMGAYDAKTGELIVKYRIDNAGFYEKIQ